MRERSKQVQGKEGKERTRKRKSGGGEEKNKQGGETTETEDNIEASFVTGPLRMEIKAMIAAGCRLNLSLSPWF